MDIEHLINKVIHKDEEVLGGVAVFKGTRVPIKNLWDYLKAGDSIESFLADFPSIHRDQVQAVLEGAENYMLQI